MSLFDVLEGAAIRDLDIYVKGDILGSILFASFSDVSLEKSSSIMCHLSVTGAGMIGSSEPACTPHVLAAGALTESPLSRDGFGCDDIKVDVGSVRAVSAYVDTADAAFGDLCVSSAALAAGVCDLDCASPAPSRMWMWTTFSFVDGGTVDACACGLLFGFKVLHGCSTHVEGEVSGPPPTPPIA